MGLDFFINGAAVSLGDHEINPRMTLLDYLRTQPGLTGTKISCVCLSRLLPSEPLPTDEPRACGGRAGARPRAASGDGRGGGRSVSCPAILSASPLRPSPPSLPCMHNALPEKVRDSLTRDDDIHHRAKADVARAPSCSPSSTRRVSCPTPSLKRLSNAQALSHTFFLDAAASTVENYSVNACLRPLLSMSGMQVTTTEGIGNSVDGYHPVQERIAECNGTQCGFCTPGHVMAMYSLLREQPGKALSPGEIEERFDGTICRCTGYRPIMTACHSFASEGVPGEEEKIEGLAVKDWKEYDPASEPTVPEAVASPTCGYAVTVEGLEWVQATSLANVGEIQKAAGDKPLKLLCGNTSTGPWGQDDTTQVFVDISAVPELAGVAMSADGLTCGATTTISALIAALMANAEKSTSYTVLVDHMKKVANWQVRNVGSWAGNLVMAKTKHFSSDIATLMMGAGATLKILSGGATKEVDIKTFLWESDDMGSDVILSITIPVLAKDVSTQAIPTTTVGDL